MSIQFIPNQPIRFNSEKFDDQACINKDVSGYEVLVQPGDQVCVQVKQECASNIACLNSELSAEKLTDTSFATGCSVNWFCDAGWSIDTGAGQATFDATGVYSTARLKQTAAGVAVGEQYAIEIDIESNTTGTNIDVYVGGNRVGSIDSSATGVHTVYGELGNNTSSVWIQPNLDFTSPSTGTFVINSVSMKQIAFCYQFVTSETEHVVNGTFTGDASGWTLGTGWTYGTNDIDHSTPAETEYLSQQITTIQHRRNINVSTTVSSYMGAGTIGVIYGGESLNSYNADGTYTLDFSANALGDDLLSYDPQSGFDATLDDLSLVEESSGWDFDPTSGFCHRTGWANRFYSTESVVAGTYYRMEIQVTMSAGSLLVECGGLALGTITKSGKYVFHFTALTTDADQYTPSSDFDGCILPAITICPLDNDIMFRLIYTDGAGATDWYDSSSADPVRYLGDYVSWCLTSLDSVISGGAEIGLPKSCFKVQVTDGDTTWTSDTQITYKTEITCSKRIRAWCDGEALGFQFGDNGDFFTLVQRFRTLYMNPVYPNDGTDYEYSTGEIKRVYARRGKRYELEFDYMDEYAHDTMSVMIVCDIFWMDAVEYNIPFKDYEPQWVERGRRNLAKSTIEIQERTGSLLFNRNC